MMDTTGRYFYYPLLHRQIGHHLTLKQPQRLMTCSHNLYTCSPILKLASHLRHPRPTPSLDPSPRVPSPAQPPTDVRTERRPTRPTRPTSAAGSSARGTVASRLLVELGVATPEEALRRVRAARPGAVETWDQERCVERVGGGGAAGGVEI